MTKLPKVELIRFRLRINQGEYSVRNILAVGMAVLLANTSSLPARAGSFPAQSHAASDLGLRGQLVAIPTGSFVQVTILDKKKLRGKLGRVANEAFEIQSVKNGKIETQSVSFGQVKSVKVIDTASRRDKAGWIVLGIIAGAAAALVIVVFAIRASIH